MAQVGTYQSRYHNTTFSGSMPDVDVFRRSRQRSFEWYDDNYLALLPKDKAAAILDIGCGLGEFLLYAKTRGYTNLTGVDISAHQLAFCRELVGCETVLIDDLSGYLDAHQGQFAAAYLGDVIEHFPKADLFGTLDAIRRVLRPGGFLLIRTNNAAGLAGTYSRYTSLTHELAFNDRTMKKALDVAGFSRIEVFGERIAVRWRPKLLLWLLLRRLWFGLLKAGYMIELGVDGPRVLSRFILARAYREV